MKKNILLVGNFLSSVGFNRGVCEDLAIRLKLTGWSVLVTSSKPERLARLVDMLTTVWREKDNYSVVQIDVYSGRAFVWAEVVSWLLSRLGKPFILTLRGGNLPEFAKRWPSHVHHLLSAATVVTTPSRYLLEKMQTYRQDICLLPNPLDLKLYDFHLRHQPESRLIWLRAFHATYNPNLAVRVLADLLPDFHDACLSMIGPDKGDGAYQETVKLSKELGVESRVVFTGGIPKTKVPSWLNKGDIFINTTHVDNTPISVLEAMACGLIIISTNVGGIPYLLDDGIDALLVPPNDPQAMATAIRRILSEPELASYLSANARAKAEMYDWEKIFPIWESILLKASVNG